jgi:hypothetical protein
VSPSRRNCDHHVRAADFCRLASHYDSDTSLALLSGAPFDDPSWWLSSNEQIVKAREIINDFAGSRRLLAHSVITPKQPGWIEEVDKAIAIYKPDSWKSLSALYSVPARGRQHLGVRGAPKVVGQSGIPDVSR